jgi:branched-chain amino acid aminotransferase
MKLGFGKVNMPIMFESKYDGNNWSSGIIKPLQNIELNPYSNSLHYGQEIFEGMKIFKNPDSGDVFTFRAEDHFNRFCRSADRMCMPKITSEVFFHGLKLIEESQKNAISNIIGQSLYLRPFMIASDGNLKIKKAREYSFYIIGTFVEQFNSDIMNIYIENTLNRSFDSYTGNIKCGGNYGASMIAQRKMEDKNCQQILWLSPDKDTIDELSSTNIFFIENNNLLTPKLNERILEGITRDSIIQIARKNGYNIIEEDLNLIDILLKIMDGKIQESFATGTASSVYAINQFNYKDCLYTLQSKDKSKKIGIELLEYQHRIKKDLF